jgi:Tol biopolymer transport system component
VVVLLLALTGPFALFADADARQQSNPSGRIAFVRGGNVWAWSPEGERELFQDGNASDPRWSPDGGEVLYVQNGGSFSNLVVYDFSSATATWLTDYEANAEGGSKDYVKFSSWVLDPAWSASGAIVYVSDRESEEKALRLWLMPSWESAGGLAPTDETDLGDIEHASLDANATAVVYTVLALGGSQGGGTYVAIRDLKSGATFPLVEGPRGAFDPALSSDGQSISLSIRADNGVSDIWMVDRASRRKAQLTRGEQAISPTWSPDGNWIAYLRPGDGGFEAWAIPVDRTARTAGEPIRLFAHDDLDATSGLSWTYSQIPLP